MKAGISREAITYIDSWLAFRYSRLEIPGFTVAIRHKGQLLYSRAFGYADLETKTTMTTDHIFRIASHSKTFTATAIMQLQEKGKLKIDDPAVQYVPWLKEHQDKRWQNVTIRQLLSHSAGVIRDGLDCDYWPVERPFPDFEEFKTELLRADLVVDNNTKFKYSNYGYTLLGLIIEAVSGGTYHEYVRQHIIDELGLKNTGPEYETAIADQLVTGYSRRDLDKQRLPIDNIDTRAMASATGFYSTAEDLGVYGAAHLVGSGQLLSDESKKEMQRTQWAHTFGDEREEYGLGLAIDQVGKRRLFGHGGAFPGHRTKTFIDGKAGLVVVVLTNCIDGDPKAINKGIHAVIEWFNQSAGGNEAEHPDGKKDAAHDPRRFAGRFMSLWEVIDIVAAGDKIVAANPDSWTPFKNPEELEYVDDSTLKITKTSAFASPDELIHFSFANGQPAKIINAGCTMLPAEAYLKQLQGKQLISNHDRPGV